MSERLSSFQFLGYVHAEFCAASMREKMPLILNTNITLTTLTSPTERLGWFHSRVVAGSQCSRCSAGAHCAGQIHEGEVYLDPMRIHWSDGETWFLDPWPPVAFLHPTQRHTDRILLIRIRDLLSLLLLLTCLPATECQKNGLNSRASMIHVWMICKVWTLFGNPSLSQAHYNLNWRSRNHTKVASNRFPHMDCLVSQCTCQLFQLSFVKE